MIDSAYMHKVFIAKSLDELRGIERSAQAHSIKVFLLRCVVWMYVVIANSIIRVLKKLFFHSKSEKTESIVIYSQGMVGDTVVLLPVVKSVRKRYASAKICWIIYSEGFSAHELIDSSFVDSVILIDAHPVVRRGSTLLFSDERLNAIRCDLFINLSPYGNRGLVGSVLREMIFAYRTHAAMAVGFHVHTWGRRGLFNEVQHYFVRNEPQRAAEVVKELHLSPAENEDLLPLNEAVKNKIIRQYLDQHHGKKIIVINLGAKFPVQKWTTEQCAGLIERLVNEMNAAVVITGTHADRHAADIIMQKNNRNVIDLVGHTSLQELIELLRLSNLCISNDTGTMHISAACGIPTIGLFTTRMSPTHWFPRGSDVTILFSFSPKTYSFDDSGDTHDTLSAIRVDDVFTVARNILR